MLKLQHGLFWIDTKTGPHPGTMFAVRDLFCGGVTISEILCYGPQTVLERLQTHPTPPQAMHLN